MLETGGWCRSSIHDCCWSHDDTLELLESLDSDTDDDDTELVADDDETRLGTLDWWSWSGLGSSDWSPPAPAEDT